MILNGCRHTFGPQSYSGFRRPVSGNYRPAEQGLVASTSVEVNAECISHEKPQYLRFYKDTKLLGDQLRPIIEC